MSDLGRRLLRQYDARKPFEVAFSWFLDTCQMLHLRQSSDPRDNVYGLLGLLQPFFPETSN